MKPMGVIKVQAGKPASFNEVFLKEPSNGEWIDTTAANAQFDLVEQEIINKGVYEFKGKTSPRELSFKAFLLNRKN